MAGAGGNAVGAADRPCPVDLETSALPLWDGQHCGRRIERLSDVPRVFQDSARGWDPGDSMDDLVLDGHGGIVRCGGIGAQLLRAPSQSALTKVRAESRERRNYEKTVFRISWRIERRRDLARACG